MSLYRDKNAGIVLSTLNFYDTWKYGRITGNPETAIAFEIGIPFILSVKDRHERMYSNLNTSDVPFYRTPWTDNYQGNSSFKA